MTDGRHPLLPGELRDAPDGRRSVRDWIVDVALFVLAAGFGLVLLEATWSGHGELAGVFDVAAGIVALPGALVPPLAPGRGRRAHALGRAVLGARGGGGDGRALQRGAAHAAPHPRRARRAVHGGDADLPGCCIRARSGDVPDRRDRRHAADRRRRRLGAVRPRAARSSCARCASAPSGSRRSSGCTSSRRARPSAGGSRARCTTCSPTASRCSASTPARSSSVPTRRRRRSRRPRA